MADGNMKDAKNDGDIHVDHDGMVFDPYNPNNREITLNEVQSILKTYGIKTNIDNIELYKRAFIHRSYTKRPTIENDQANIKIAPRPNNCLVGSSRVDLQACKLEYSIVSPK